MDAKDSRAAHAVALSAEYDYAVLPCKELEKTPAIRHGCNDATRDTDVIEKWFEQLPNANVGIATGEPSGVVVVDVDTKSCPDAIENARKLCGLDDFTILDTMTVQTPSGGQHWYFKAPDFPVRNYVGIVPGVDIRGDGGYVVVPPSATKQGTYTFISDWPAVAMPDALRDRLKSAQKQKGNGAALTWDDVTGIAVDKGGRNDALTRLAGRLWNNGLRTDELYAVLAERNKLYKPPLSDDEVRRIVASAERNFERKSPLIEFLGPDISTVAPPEPKVVIPEILPCSSTIFAGAGHEGKTVSLLFMTVRITLGLPIFGRDTREGPVLFVFGEDSTDDVRRLVHFICRNDPQMRGQGKKLHERLHLLNAAKAGGSLLLQKSGSWHPGSWFDWIERIIENKGYSAVILDTVSSLGLPESIGMNDAAAAYHLAANRIAEQHNVAFVGSHHVSQWAATERHIGMYAARGATAITDNARCVIQVQRHQDGDPYQCPVETDNLHVVRWHIVKHKWSPLTAETPLWLVGDKYQCSDYRELTGARLAEAQRLAGIERRDADTEATFAKIEDSLDVCEKRNVAATKDNLADFADGLGVNRARRAIDQMVNAGLIVGDKVSTGSAGPKPMVYRRKRYGED